MKSLKGNAGHGFLSSTVFTRNKNSSLGHWIEKSIYNKSKNIDLTLDFKIMFGILADCVVHVAHDICKVLYIP